MMGVPALIAAQIFQLRHQLGHSLKPTWSVGIFAFLAGSVGLALAAVIFFGLLIFTIPATLDQATEQAALMALLLAHIPLVFVEGIFTMLLSLFLLRVKPELLES